MPLNTKTLLLNSYLIRTSRTNYGANISLNGSLGRFQKALRLENRILKPTGSKMRSMPSLRIILKQQFSMVFIFFLIDRSPPQRQQRCAQLMEFKPCTVLEKKASSPQSLSYIPFPPDFLASLTGGIAGALPVLHKLSV